MCWYDLIPIVLSVVSIGIAIYSARQTSKETASQIAAIKDLCRLQIEASIKQLDIELDKAQLKVKQGKAEHDYLYEVNHGSMSYIANVKEMKMREFPAYKAQNDYKFYCDYEKQLKGIQQNLRELKKNFEE